MASMLPLVESERAECCVPVAREGLTGEKAGALAVQLKAIAEPTRLRLLSMIAAHDGGEACVCDLTDPVGLSQPTVSHHLRILVDGGFLTRSKRGSWSFYTLVPGAFERLRDALGDAVPSPGL